MSDNVHVLSKTSKIVPKDTKSPWYRHVEEMGYHKRDFFYIEEKDGIRPADPEELGLIAIILAQHTDLASKLGGTGLLVSPITGSDGELENVSIDGFAAR